MSDEVTTGGDGTVNRDNTAAREEGTAFLRQGKFQEAAVALRRAVEVEPNDESAWRLLGGALASGGDAEGAVDAFERSVEINPNSAKNHYNAAVALQAVGRIVEARAAIAEALVLDPDYQQAQSLHQELNDLFPGGGAATNDWESPSALESDIPSQESPSLRPVAGSNESRIPPPPPPGGYAPPPPMPPGGYRPPAPGSSYAPPPSPGGYPPQGAQSDNYNAYAPPPALGQAYGMAAPEVNGTTILVLGIVGLVCFQILGPVAWVLGNNALKTLDQYPHADQSQRGTVVAGRIIGMIATGFLVLTVLYMIVMVLIAIGGSR
ncbi:MAG: tetratricopeptide repeat protein [Armatimonadota bacterium]